MGDNTGYGWHADFFNGWKDGAIPGLLASCPQGEYGNEDVGSCPSFEKSSVSNNACKLKTTYVEKVTTPGQNLPGCNPVSDKNPAPYYETAPLGTYSTDCKLVSGGGPPPPAGSGAPHSSATTSSTLTTAVKTSTPPAKPSPSNSQDISCPASNHKTYKFNGKTFRVQCGVDHSGGDLKSVSAHSLAECIAACAKTNGCVDVSLSGTACYMKSSLGRKVPDIGIVGARLLDSGTAGPVTNTNVDKARVTEAVTVTAGSHRREARHAHAQAHAAHMRRGSF